MLGFRLNEEQESFRVAVRSFAEKSLAPRVEELERTETFPLDLFRELGRLGYLGVGYPEEYGGSGGDMVMRCLLIEEIARVNCGFAAALLAHVGLGCIPIFRFGTEAQKREYLVPAIRGERLGSFGLSEPNSGSDAASIRTRAERRGDVYVINGTKMFITNGNIADYCLVAAYTDPSRRGYCMREAAMAKLFASEVAQRVTWEAVQVFGGYGYITEFPVERFWRDARLMTITEGTTEIQLTIIARELGL